MFYEVVLGDHEVPLKNGIGQYSNDAKFQRIASIIDIRQRGAQRLAERPLHGVCVADDGYCAVVGWLREEAPGIMRAGARRNGLRERKSAAAAQRLRLYPQKAGNNRSVHIQTTRLIS